MYIPTIHERISLSYLAFYHSALFNLPKSFVKKINIAEDCFGEVG